jgi:hypothetical protein
VRGVMELMNNELARGERETQFARVPVESCFAILSSACTIVSTVELVWKAMELLQLDEDRMLRAELSLQEVLLSGHLQPGE